MELTDGVYLNILLSRVYISAPVLDVAISPILEGNFLYSL